MKKLIDRTVADFAAVTASDAPAPGGGSVSALAGALAAALAQMVANLTVGREKYAASQEKMQDLLEAVPFVQQELLEAVDKDSAAFDGYMAALSLPKGTDGEKERRKAAMQEGLRQAALVPLRTAQLAVTLFPHLEAAVTLGNPNAVTDAMVAAMLARTCVLGAVFNVRVNLASIRDEAFVHSLAKECNELQSAAEAAEHRILQAVPISR